MRVRSPLFLYCGKPIRQLSGVNALLWALELKKMLWKIVEIHSKLKTLALGRDKKLLLYSWQRYYERANKPHTLLARMLRDEVVLRSPYSLRDANRGIAYEPGVAKVFYDFFSRLYALPTTHGCSVQTRTVDRLFFLFVLPKLSSESVESMNTPITADEVEGVLKSVQPGKSSGPDGFTYLYYQTFTNSCSLILPLCV